MKESEAALYFLPICPPHSYQFGWRIYSLFFVAHRTIAIQDQESGHHEHRVPVGLQVAAVPGEASSELPVPDSHTDQAEQPQQQEEQVGTVEEGRRPHVCYDRREQNMYCSIWTWVWSDQCFKKKEELLQLP